MFTIVEFPSEGATLRGRLYVRPASRPLPVVVMAHGLSATISGMTADRYAEVFRDAGFAVLLFDHRNFGISDGEPRQQINKWVQARGYRDAMSFLATRPDIDRERMALWGDSMSAAEVIVVGAIDARVKAVVAQVPACGDNPPPPDPDGSLFAAIREKLLHGDVGATPDSTIGPLPDRVERPAEHALDPEGAHGVSMVHRARLPLRLEVGELRDARRARRPPTRCCARPTTRLRFSSSSRRKTRWVAATPRSRAWHSRWRPDPRSSSRRPVDTSGCSTIRVRSSSEPPQRSASFSFGT